MALARKKVGTNCIIQLVEQYYAEVRGLYLHVHHRTVVKTIQLTTIIGLSGNVKSLLQMRPTNSATRKNSTIETSIAIGDLGNRP